MPARRKSRSSWGSGDGSDDDSLSMDELDGLEETESEKSLLPKQQWAGSLSQSPSTTSLKVSEEVSKVLQKKEPWRFYVRGLVESDWWPVVVQTVIFLNIVAMVVECYNRQWTCWSGINDAFLIFFCFELVFRLFAYRQQFFLSKAERWWNIFDFALVFIGVVDQWIGRNSSALKLLRIFRVFRALRVVRHIAELRMLIESFILTLQAAGWIFVFFFFLVCITGMMTTMIIGRRLEDWPEEDREEIAEDFGTMPRSMFTLFRFSTLDDWSATGYLVDQAIPGATILFAGYIVLTSYSIIALLTGVIAQEVGEIHARQEEKTAHEEYFGYLNQIKEKYIQESQLRGGNFRGFTFAELWDLLDLDMLRMKAEGENKVDIEAEDIQDFFKVLDYNGDGMISWHEFKLGMHNMHGPAKRLAMAVLQSDIRRLKARIDAGGRKLSLGGAFRREAKIARLQARLDSIEMLLRQVVRLGLRQPMVGVALPYGA